MGQNTVGGSLPVVPLVVVLGLPDGWVVDIDMKDFYSTSTMC
jgi:hypothetical protein